ncbi:hypothetical protein A374_05331 [Fictibacillus macauensis ZFHKF-1]|uniref:Uncharacterized protein n=1 Tax=Fictibacillus macauensis ZFHKF-1 TaxID=1196324 RepID=I8UHH5_9BACL|nr:hypothetical protein [Fictibacillus macauensis]EIT86360.1 hypothetical protein A374_05331 [Fictibacillus macauensis ZFHKF-1]
MDENMQYARTLDQVEAARKAIEEAQSNYNPEEFQNARQLLSIARQGVKQTEHDATLNPTQQKELFHAREHLRHLQETIHAIEITRYT